ncbi:MAG: ribonuclease D [Actinomycetota bacterium]
MSLRCRCLLLRCATSIRQKIWRQPMPKSDAGRPQADVTWVDNDAVLDDAISFLLSQQRYSIDTEFHRERTYFPRLALVQLAAVGRIFVIDPLSVGRSQFARLFDSDATAIFHAAQQDLEVLQHAFGCVPRRIFDTQLAAGFIGYSSPSLSSLATSFAGVNLPKGDRLTDWLRRPLTAAQIDYAAGDVRYLEQIADAIQKSVEQLGRLAWAEGACEELRLRPNGPTDPERAWMKVKDIRTLKGKSRWVAQALAEWREKRAAELDIPVRHVMSDIAIVGVAQKLPKTADDLSHIRGFDGKQAHGSMGRFVIDAVQTGIERSGAGELKMPSSDGDDLDRALRPAVTLVSAWVSELSRQKQLDPALLGTRQDIVDLLRKAPSARLGSGWRADIVGNDVDDLVAGRAGLTFTADGGLKLISLNETV